VQFMAISCVYEFMSRGSIDDLGEAGRGGAVCEHMQRDANGVREVTL
jgi:hypothetical protein